MQLAACSTRHGATRHSPVARFVARAFCTFVLVLGCRAAVPRTLLLDAAYANATDIAAVGERGTIFRSTDTGATWQPAASPTRATLTGIAFAAGSNHGWAVGHDALILSSADSGRTWTKQFQDENLEDSFLDVLALDARRVIAVGAYGLFVSTTDGGATWTSRKLADDDFHLNRLTRGPTGKLYLAGERGTLLASADKGATWSKIPTAYEGSFYGILPLAEHTLLAYGLRGHVFRSTDDGATWTQIQTPQPVLIATAARSTDKLIVLAGQARSLFVSRDDGQTFTAAEQPPTMAIAELLALPDSTVLAVGEAGRIVIKPPFESRAR